MSLQKRRVTFIRQGLSKSDRPDHLAPKIFVPCFKEDKRLDPTRMLKFYLKQREGFRGSEKKGIFSHFGNLIMRCQSKQFQDGKLAYTDGQVKVKGYSTRSIGPSWALFNCASMKAILEAADWSKETTFTKFYLKDVNITPLN